MMWLTKIMLTLAVVGCVGCSTYDEPTSHQSALGQGIVEGTKGYQQLQNDPETRNGIVKKVRGQVHHLEGAAYVVHTGDHVEIRLPIDENTSIDRPAHKGDWIDAYLNHDGRAVMIRNVDDQVVLD